MAIGCSFVFARCNVRGVTPQQCRFELDVSVLIWTRRKVGPHINDRLEYPVELASHVRVQIAPSAHYRIDGFDLLFTLALQFANLLVDLSDPIELLKFSL